MRGETEAIDPFTIVPARMLGFDVYILESKFERKAFGATSKLKLGGEGGKSKQRCEGEYVPFLSSTVTVSPWHFMRNLCASISKSSYLQIQNRAPNELHVCFCQSLAIAILE